MHLGNWPERHTFPMEKFHQTALSLLNDPDAYYFDEHNDINEREDGTVMKKPRRHQLVISQDHFYRPLPMNIFPRAFLSPPICPKFLHSFLSGALSTEDCRLIGFREQTSRPELIERTVVEVAGTVLTAQLAMKYGLASNLAGGTHHAEWNRGKGYTILNDLAVVAYLMTWREDRDKSEEFAMTTSSENNALKRELYRGEGRGVDRVLVVDCDVHQGDGTATFSNAADMNTSYTSSQAIRSCLQNKLFTLDLHAANNYPHPKETCTYDIGLPDGCNDEMYLSTLEDALDKALREVRPQLVLYNAGVDVYEGDKLGRLSLTMKGMRDRDYHVIRTCVDAKIPIAVVVGGGYDNDVKELGKRHALVHRVAAKIWRMSRCAA
jgi:acetoin utilization deacetylase AcuC-like enzyme